MIIGKDKEKIKKYQKEVKNKYNLNIIDVLTSFCYNFCGGN